MNRRVWDANEAEGDAGIKLEDHFIELQMSNTDLRATHEYVLWNTTVMSRWIR